MENRLEYIFTKYNIVEEDQREIIGIFNESLIEISEGILGKAKENKTLTSKNKGEKRWASKKASEYAEENGVSLEELPGEKITKKEIEEYVKRRARESKESKISERVTLEREKSKESNKEKKEEKCICSGITKKGEACNKRGVEQPEGAKRKYCEKHSVDWRTYECDTDSSEDEKEEEE